MEDGRVWTSGDTYVRGVGDKVVWGMGRLGMRRLKLGMVRGGDVWAYKGLNDRGGPGAGAGMGNRDVWRIEGIVGGQTQ